MKTPQQTLTTQSNPNGRKAHDKEMVMMKHFMLFLLALSALALAGCNRSGSATHTSTLKITLSGPADAPTCQVSGLCNDTTKLTGGNTPFGPSDVTVAAPAVFQLAPACVITSFDVTCPAPWDVSVQSFINLKLSIDDTTSEIVTVSKKADTSSKPNLDPSACNTAVAVLDPQCGNSSSVLDQALSAYNAGQTDSTKASLVKAVSDSQTDKFLAAEPCNALNGEIRKAQNLVSDAGTYPGLEDAQKAVGTYQGDLLACNDKIGNANNILSAQTPPPACVFNTGDCGATCDASRTTLDTCDSGLTAAPQTCDLGTLGADIGSSQATLSAAETSKNVLSGQINAAAQDWCTVAAAPDGGQSDLDKAKQCLASQQAAIGQLYTSVANAQSAAQAEQAKLAQFPCSINFTVNDISGTTPIANALITEINVKWDSYPDGQNQPRTCTTNAAGTCTVKYLLCNVGLRFSTVAQHFVSGDDSLTLTSSVPMSKEVRLLASGAMGDLVPWSGYMVTADNTFNMTGSFMQVQADGSLKVVYAADGLACSITTGVNVANVDPDCTVITGLSAGCAIVKGTLSGKSASVAIRVKPDPNTPDAGSSDTGSNPDAGSNTPDAGSDFFCPAP
jgi:hypothetical protein